ncbi:MAG: DinB family protein [Terriglobia bacterium]
MHRISSLVVLAALFPVGAAQALAQEPTPAGAPAEELLGLWQDTGKKVIDMAEDFPEDNYDYKPTPEVRSFAEQLLHVASANYFFMGATRGEKAGGGNFTREKYPTKADIVAVLKKSFADGAELIQQTDEAGLRGVVKFPFGNRMVSRHAMWIIAVRHDAEHYGNLVVYYRLNGLVPPATRAQQARQQQQP